MIKGRTPESGPIQEHPELGVLALLRLHLDDAAKQFDDPAAEIEAEAGAPPQWFGGEAGV